MLISKSDIQMGSPPPMHGSSSTTKGILRGKAQGNIFNLADADNKIETAIGAVIGKVKFYRLERTLPLLSLRW